MSAKRSQYATFVEVAKQLSVVPRRFAERVPADLASGFHYWESAVRTERRAIERSGKVQTLRMDMQLLIRNPEAATKILSRTTGVWFEPNEAKSWLEAAAQCWFGADQQRVSV